MAKRRANGEGNIRKRKDGRWEGRYTAGHDPETGKAIYRNVLGKTQAEVKEKLKAAIQESKKVDVVKGKQYTVGQWVEVWLENYAKVHLRPSTYQTDLGFLENHIRPNIGKIPLAKLTTLDIQRFYKKLLTSGRVKRIESRHKPKGLSAKTVRNLHQMLSSALNFARNQRLIPANPAEGCALPKLEHREMQTLTAEQLGAFFREAQDSGVYELYYLDLATGLRPGELLGLQWSDIGDGTMTIRRAINDDDELTDGKNENAQRTISLVGLARSELEAQKMQLLSEGLSLYWVFPARDAGPTKQHTLRRFWSRYKAHNGLNGAITLYELRHTYVSVNDTMPEGLKKKVLGHSENMDTEGTYGHLKDGDLERAAEYSDRAFRKLLKRAK